MAPKGKVKVKVKGKGMGKGMGKGNGNGKGKEKDKEKDKEKEKVEADLIPLNILNKYKIGGNAFSILRDSQKWNDVIISKNPEHVLRGISGLEDTLIDKICGGLNKYMDSLKSDATVFSRDTLITLDEIFDATDDTDDADEETLSELASLKPVILEAKEYARQFYSREEVIQKLSEKFGDPHLTNNVYDLWFTSKSTKAKDAYLEMSSIRASQRKVEENEAASELKDDFGNVVAAQNEEAEHKPLGEEEKNQKEAASEVKDELGNVVAELKEEAEHKPVGEEEKNQEAALSQQASDQKELAENELVQKSEEAEKRQLQQVTMLMEALKLQEEMLKEIDSYQPEIATKDHLDNLQVRITRNLNTLGDELAKGVASGVEILTKPRKFNALRVSSEVTEALSELHTAIKERIKSQSETSIQQRITICILQRIAISIIRYNYEEFFPLALETDDPTLEWLLSQVHRLQGLYPAKEENIQSLLRRLAPLATAESGQNSYVFTIWFEATIKKAMEEGLEITEEVLVANRHIKKKYGTDQERVHASVKRFINEFLEDADKKASSSGGV